MVQTLNLHLQGRGRQVSLTSLCSQGNTAKLSQKRKHSGRPMFKAHASFGHSVVTGAENWLKCICQRSFEECGYKRTCQRSALACTDAT